MTSFLDLAQRDQQVSDQFVRQHSEPRLPVSYGEGFDAAWQENQLFGQSVAHSMAREKAFDDYAGELRQRGIPYVEPQGRFVQDQYNPPDLDQKMAAAREAVIKAGGTPIDDQELDNRAVQVSRAARQTYVDVAAREKAGGGAGLFFGGLASSAVDPLNLAAIPLGGGEGPILATALKFGAAAAAIQGGNEALQSGFREQVQPGYAASGEPLANVLMAGAQGAVIGGGTKALGNLWTRVKTGAWPTSVRDAGNLLESEANVQQSNIYPGVEGEVAHREALGGAIDNIQKGEPVSVAGTVWRDLDIAAGGAGEVRGAGAFVERASDRDFLVKSGQDAGDLLSLRESPEAIQAGISTVSPSNRGQGVGTALYEKAVEFAADRGLPLRSDMSVSPAAIRVYEGLRRRGYEVAEAPGTDTLANGHKINERAGYVYEVRPGFEDIRARAGAAAEAAQAARATAQEGPAPQLPFEATAAEQAAATAAKPLQDRIAQVAERGGHVLAPDEIAAIAARMAKMGPEEAADALRDVQTRPHQMAAEPARVARETPQEPVAALPPAEVARVVASPEHEAALRADIDRARMTKDVKIPAGVDEKGEPVFRSLDSAMDEVDGFKAAAEQIQACAAPQPEGAE